MVTCTRVQKKITALVWPPKPSLQWCYIIHVNQLKDDPLSMCVVGLGSTVSIIINVPILIMSSIAILQYPAKDPRYFEV